MNVLLWIWYSVMGAIEDLHLAVMCIDMWGMVPMCIQSFWQCEDISKDEGIKNGNKLSEPSVDWLKMMETSLCFVLFWCYYTTFSVTYISYCTIHEFTLAWTSFVAAAACLISFPSLFPFSPSSPLSISLFSLPSYIALPSLFLPPSLLSSLPISFHFVFPISAFHFSHHSSFSSSIYSSPSFLRLVSSHFFSYTGYWLAGTDTLI